MVTQGNWIKQKEGRLAQLVERLPYKERVRSSSLLTPTIKEMMTLVIISFILRVLIARTSNMQGIFKEVRRERAEGGGFLQKE